VKIQNSKYILLVFPIGVFLFFYYGLNFDGLYGQDAYEYLRYSNALKNFIITGENPGDYFWPIFYPLFGALTSFIFQNIGFSLMLISTVSVSISAYCLYKILTLLFKNTKYPTLYVFVFFMLSPIVFKSGLLVMSDLLALCFIVLSAYHYLKFSQKKQVKYYYFIAVFSFLAFMTRYASAAILIPFVISASLLFFKQKNILKHIVFITLIIGLLSLPHILIRIHHSTDFLAHQWLKSWSFNNFLKYSFTTVDGTSNYFLPNIIYAFSNIFHPRFLFVGVIFIPLFLLKRIHFNHSIVFITSFILYAFFLAGIPFQNSRFLLLSFPIGLILLYPVFNYLSELKWVKKIFYLGIVCSLILQFILIKKTFQSTLQRNQLEIEITQKLTKYQNNTLYSFDIDIALQGRGLEFDYKNLWKKRYTDLKENDLILFHPTKFQKQWQGKNPILNFDYFNKNYSLKIIEPLPKGWKLYKVQTK